VIRRLSRTMDVAALSLLAEGLELHVDDEIQACESAQRLAAALSDAVTPGTVEVSAQVDEETQHWRVQVRRLQHGNWRVTVFDRVFAHGADYAVLLKAGKTFLGLLGPGACIVRGAGDRRREKSVGDFREVIQWLRAEAERGISKQRYKGLGEMNPEQLWETTMDPKVRRLLRVEIEDVIEADQIFTTLMGEDVEPRRAFIETHALQAANIDV